MGPLLKATPTVPELVVEQATTSGAGTMVIAQVVVETTPLASVILMLKLPAAVGVPVTAPVAVFRVRPAGKVPTMEKTYGVVPPVTVMGPLLKTTPTVPELVVEQATTSGAGTIVIAQVGSGILMLKLPAEAGVPVTAPVAVFGVRPAGKVPTMEKT